VVEGAEREVGVEGVAVLAIAARELFALWLFARAVTEAMISSIS